MRNKFILGLMLVFTIALSAQNYSFFENDVRFEEGLETVTLTHFGEFQITDSFGFTDYASVENNQDGISYGQILLGVYYKGITNVTTSMFIGKESYTNDTRLGVYTSYITGDKLMLYGFYQKNINESYDSEWYDLRLRYGVHSGESNSVYVGVRYMKAYGLGIPIGVRQSLGDKANLYISYATYYNVEDGREGSDRAIPTLSLNFEFL